MPEEFRVSIEVTKANRRTLERESGRVLSPGDSVSFGPSNLMDARLRKHYLGDLARIEVRQIPEWQPFSEG